eukprot:Awhi_evm1s6717
MFSGNDVNYDEDESDDDDQDFEDDDQDDDFVLPENHDNEVIELSDSDFEPV